MEADKLKSHLQKDHSDIRDAHLQQRRQLFDAQNNRYRRKLDPAKYFDQRHRSISPTFSETEEEEVAPEDSAELPITESMEIEEQSNDSFLSSNADSQSASAATSDAIKNGVAAAAVADGGKRKFPIIKKKKRARLTVSII
uniref:Uncharacterized protein n=1 Tax=Panagrolaimus superbus TaxID=310955 RepID=A0A914YM22_9BILA